VVQRDDVTVMFSEPETARARHALARLPGVLATEGFRAVPARLRFEHRSKRIEITGLAPGAQLRRLVDAGLRPVALPPGGVLLTRRLGELLGVAPGDTLTAAVLEGARPVKSLQVAGFIDEPLGMGAYMDLGELNRVMREQGSLSGAYLAVDQPLAAALYARLKGLPAVSGVALREAVVKSFNEILDRSMRTVSLINVVFASVIAFGVVYNGARIALSERGSELASLRVLGFTRREVTWLLLGEQAVLTVLALPLGMLLGVFAAWLLSLRLNTDLYRIPLVFENATFSIAVIETAIAAILSGLLVARRIRGLDLVAVLKTRE